MTNFHEVCHGNCALRYVGGVLDLRKLGFSGLKVQFDVKKTNVRGLMAKISHYWPILATRTHLWPIFMEYSMELYWNFEILILENTGIIST